MTKLLAPLIEPLSGTRRVYTKPRTEIVMLTDEAATYLTETRKLSQTTLDAFGVGCTKRGAIAIPFVDEKGERQLVKFRHQTGGMLKLPQDDGTEREVKTFIEKNGKPVLLGSHMADPREGPLIICFGDYDAMSVYQAGLPNAVSLPYGDGGFDWIDLQWEFLQKFREIIFFPDLDEYPNPEAQMRAEAKRAELYMRLDKSRCKVVQVSEREDAKDANALLVTEGEAAIQTAIENADWVPEENLVRVADYLEEVLIEGQPFGYTELDRTTGGTSPGDLIIIAGDSEAGKTTVTLNFMAKAVDLGIPILFWSGEQRVPKIRAWFERIVAGPDYLKCVIQRDTQKEYYFPHDDYKEFIRGWYRDYFYQYNNFSTTQEKYFEVAELAIKRHGVRILVIDNLMAFTGGSGDGYYQAQGDFAQSCKMFAELWSVSIILICHNKKMPSVAQGRMRYPEKDDVEGSKKVTSWADMVLQMFKIPPEFREGEFAQTDGFMVLCKTREGGGRGIVPIVIDNPSNRIRQLKDKNVPLCYGWEADYQAAFAR